MSRRRERGSGPLEVIVMSAVVAFVVLVALQIFSVMYAGQAAGRAAWDAARAQSLGQSAAGAASASVPGGVTLENVEVFGDGVRVTVTSPDFLPLVPVGSITRTAYVP